ncbi:hypothetical protein [Schlesneria sp. T3-172]|uniref:hypothetical protein n=1 Tax=Schlesneria sphaerica TaxID=3373610 RepID=UPI0037CB466D
MNCQQCEGEYASLLEGIAQEQIQKQIDQHLIECPNCRKSLEETRQVVARLTQDADLSVDVRIANSVMDHVLARPRLAGPTATRRNLKMSLSAAATFLIAMGVVLWKSTGMSGVGHVLADDLAVAQQKVGEVKSATYSLKFFPRRCLKEQQVKLAPEQFETRECFYKAPGKYREVSRDRDGNIQSIDIRDSVKLKRLSIYPTKKKAILYALNEPMDSQGGPFVSAGNMMAHSNLKMLGRRVVAGREAVGFRCPFASAPNDAKRWNADFWIDAENKQLVEHQVPGMDIIDPDKVYDEPLQGVYSGFRLYDITFDVPLDDELFRLDSPKGFELQVVGTPSAKESDVVEFLRIVALVLGGTFPDQMPNFSQGNAHELITQLDGKAKDELTSAETMLQTIRQRYLRPDGPIEDFINDSTEFSTWKYLGDEVKLGDKNEIVCWYRPRNSRTYRVIYGDLSIKDLMPSDLPLPVTR